MIGMKEQKDHKDVVHRALFVGSMLLLCLVTMITLASCIFGSAENNTGETAGTGILSVDSAIRSYYGLTEEEALTVQMLEGVYSLRISATSYTYEREGYTLVEVTVNGNEQFGGVLERCVTESRFSELYASCTEEEVELPFGKGGKSTVNLKKSLESFYVFSENVNLADGRETNVYILSGDIVLREKNSIVYGLAELGLIDEKFILGREVDLSRFDCLPKLEHLILCGIDAKGSRDGLMLHQENFIAQEIDYES